MQGVTSILALQYPTAPTHVGLPISLLCRTQISVHWSHSIAPHAKMSGLCRGVGTLNMRVNGLLNSEVSSALFGSRNHFCTTPSLALSRMHCSST